MTVEQHLGMAEFLGAEAAWRLRLAAKDRGVLTRIAAHQHAVAAAHHGRAAQVCREWIKPGWHGRCPSKCEKCGGRGWVLRAMR